MMKKLFLALLLLMSSTAIAQNREFVAYDSTEAEVFYVDDAGTMRLRDSSNDGNPVFQLGFSDTEEVNFRATYESGGTALDYVHFESETASATADKGLFRFTVDGAEILDIDDGGIDFASGAMLSFDGTDLISGTPANNELAIWTGSRQVEGTPDITYDSVGKDFVFQTSVRVGTAGDTTPDALFDLTANTTTETALRIQPASGPLVATINVASTSFANNDIFTLDQDGDVGIATAAPTEKLHVTGNAIITGYLNPGLLQFTDASELTIATGAITATQTYHDVDTEADAASDDLDTINGGTAGDELIIRPENDARDVVVKNGTGNIVLDADVTLDDITDSLRLIFDGTQWIQTGGSAQGGTPGGADTQFQYNDGGSFGGAASATYDDTDGSVAFQNATDSTTGFQVLDADGGTPIFNVDTTNERVGIGTATSPGAKLEVNTATSTDTGLILQTTDDNGTSDLFQTQDSAGTAYITVAGDTPHILEFKNTGNSVFIGEEAGINDDLSGQQAVYVGFGAGRGITTGDGNTAVGYAAMYNAGTTASNNVGLGRFALYNVTGTQNFAMGRQSLEENTSGNNNVGLGDKTSQYNKTGTGNVSIGTNAGRGVSTNSHSNNTSVGYLSGEFVTTGSNNTNIGAAAGRAITTGQRNINIGLQAADNLTTGSNNLIIGYNIDAQSATASNQMSIGNLIFSEGIDGTGTTVSSGNLGIGDTTPDSRLEVLSSTDPQVRITHTDGVDDLTIGVDANGDTTLTPSGGDVSIAGRLASPNGAITLGAAATAIAVTRNVHTVTGDAGANTIATITGGLDGQRLTLIFVDGLVTVTDDNTHAADSVDLSAAFTSADDTTLTLVYDGTSWYETSRSAN